MKPADNHPAADPLFAELANLPTPRPVLANGIRYSHAAMIDMLINEPWIKQNELARRFQKSPSWISTIMASDAFQAAFAERKDEVVDPALRLSIEEQFKGVVARSLEIIRDKLNGPSESIPDQLALRSLELASRAAGYGARAEPPVQVNITNQIEGHADDLVKLLRRTRVTVEGESNGTRPPESQSAPEAPRPSAGSLSHDGHGTLDAAQAETLAPSPA